MKITKRKDPKYPIRVTLSTGESIKVPRQGKFSTAWLRRHGCPFVSLYEVLQWLGIDTSKKYPLHLWKWARNNLTKYMGATLRMKGEVAMTKHFTKGKAHVKFYAPKDITTDRMKRFLKAGSFIIITRRKPSIHYYVVFMDKGKIYAFNYTGGGNCRRYSAKFLVSTKCRNKNYGGMIVITKKTKKAKK